MFGAGGLSCGAVVDDSWPGRQLDEADEEEGHCLKRLFGWLNKKCSTIRNQIQQNCIYFDGVFGESASYYIHIWGVQSVQEKLKHPKYVNKIATKHIWTWTEMYNHKKTYTTKDCRLLNQQKPLW